MTVANVAPSPPARGSVSRRTSVQVVLQDDRRGGRVELGLSLPPVALAGSQPALSFSARKSFVLTPDRNRRPRAQGFHEHGGRSRLLVGLPVESPGDAHHDASEPVFLACEPIDFSNDPVEGIVCTHLQRRQRTCHRAGAIADCQSDPSSAEIDAKHAPRMSHTQML